MTWTAVHGIGAGYAARACPAGLHCLSLCLVLRGRFLPCPCVAQDLALHDCLYRSRGRARWVAWGRLDEYWEDRMQPKGSLRHYLSGLDGTNTSLVTYNITAYTSSLTNSTDTAALNCSEGEQGGPEAPSPLPGGGSGAPHRTAGEEGSLVETLGRHFVGNTSACQGAQRGEQGRGGLLSSALDECGRAQGFIFNPSLVSCRLLSSLMLTLRS